MSSVTRPPWQDLAIALDDAGGAFCTVASLPGTTASPFAALAEQASRSPTSSKNWPPSVTRAVPGRAMCAHGWSGSRHQDLGSV